MIISLNWLSDHVDLTGLKVDEISRLLTFAGVEVEEIEQRGVSSDRVVVAQVVSAGPHPDAERLSVCRVEAGQGPPLQIVCGAKNFKPGDKVPLALEGAVLPGNVAIKKGRLRGIESQGMMCSGRELGLGDDHEGLLILPPDAPVGTPLGDYLGSRSRSRRIARTCCRNTAWRANFARSGRRPRHRPSRPAIPSTPRVRRRPAAPRRRHARLGRG
jgi:phenylalanyl-tRNA synthetase beta chain